MGAIFFLTYLAHRYHVSFTWHVYFALGSAVWLIYTTDHLMDSAKVPADSGDRHSFHQRHYRILLFMAGLVLMLALINLFFLDELLIKAGALLSAVCVGYLMLVYFVKKLWIKELLVALAYASGIYLAPLVEAGATWTDLLNVLELAGVAFLNLLIFSSFDAHKDFRDGFNSIVLRLGRTRTSLIIWTGAALLSVLSFALWFRTGDDLQLLYFMMTAVLVLVYAFPGYFSSVERFRTIGDGIFYLPLVFLWL